LNRIILIGFVYFFLTALITGCSTVAPPAPAEQIPWKKREIALNEIQNWTINGKIALIAANNSGSATVDWTQHNKSYTISLMGPLGANGIKLTGEPGHVVMHTADGKTFTASNPEQLLAEKWGWHLPVSNINYWVRGMTVPGIPAKTHFDNYGRLTDLSQQGFEVQYLSYTKSGGRDLPSRISINSPGLKVKMIVYSWTVS
jgi:outer membrane lipoprotein LolB